MRKKAPTAVDLWNRAVREAYVVDAPQPPEMDEEAKKVLADVLAMTDAEIDAELVREGVDLEEQRRKADASYDAMMAQLARWEAARTSAEAPANEGSTGAKPMHALTLAAAVAAAATTVSVVTYVGTRPPDEKPVVKTPDAGPAPPPSATAEPEPTPLPEKVPAPDDKGQKAK